MCREKRKLPIGIENFEQIIKDDFYYVDKTGLISELLRNWGMVNLFTRPRRFGKSLNMSMLEHFFSVEGDKSIFDGLKISKDKKLCEEYMGKFPVIFISLKNSSSLLLPISILLSFSSHSAVNIGDFISSGNIDINSLPSFVDNIFLPSLFINPFEIIFSIVEALVAGVPNPFDKLSLSNFSSTCLPIFSIAANNVASV